MPYLIRSACLTGYLDLARSVGIDPFRLLRQVGLERSCLSDPDQKIPTDAVIRLLEISASVSRIEDFGLRLAQTRSLSNLGPIALAARDAKTLRDGLEAAIHYQQLHNEAMLLSLVSMGDVVIFRSELIAEHCTPGRQPIELLVGVAHQFIRQLFGGTWRSRPVWFTHGPPADMASHLRVFGPWVEFGQECNGTLLEARDLETPLPGSDPAMAKHVKQYLEPMLAQAGPTVTEKTRRAVYDLLASHRASVEQVALHLGMNRRGLHRQLAREGETFSSILNAVRIELARRYVADRVVPLTEVAHLLGFSELSGFSRWFRTEFERSPMAWRQAEHNRGSPVSPQN